MLDMCIRDLLVYSEPNPIPNLEYRGGQADLRVLQSVSVPVL